MQYNGKIYRLEQAQGNDSACSQCSFDEDRTACDLAGRTCGDRGFFVQVESVPEQTTKVKSDGGSSDYYKLKIKRASDGQEFECEMGDVIYSVFGGDFDLGNIVKACRRMYLDTQGAGKDGIDAEYDGKKIEWFTKDFLQRVNSKGE